MSTPHTLSQYDTELYALKLAASSMGRDVLRQFKSAVDAIVANDGSRAARVLLEESRVNEMHISNALRCNQIIVRRQPAASDLREVIALLHINNDLERIGDESKKIAIRQSSLSFESLPLQRETFESMAQTVANMLALAVDSVEAPDNELVLRLYAMDATVDRVRDQLHADLVAGMSNSHADVASALAMAFVVQSVERIGDHACNVAEYVASAVDGIDHRHRFGSAGNCTPESVRVLR